MREPQRERRIEWPVLGLASSLARGFELSSAEQRLYPEPLPALLGLSYNHSAPQIFAPHSMLDSCKELALQKCLDDKNNYLVLE